MAAYSLADTNLFAYCGNNPVTRQDENGDFFETALDVISLVASIVEVAANPADPWAWAGLVGDTIDLIPFVSGVGEVTRAVKTVDRVTDALSDAEKTVSYATRSGAVRKAWKEEFTNVQNGGMGLSRVWTPSERVELLSTGRVKGYQGHHMRSVRGYPHLAGNPNNIQFLTRAEHLRAHGGNWKNITHGRFDYTRR